MAKQPLYKQIQPVIMQRLNGTSIGSYFRTNDFVEIFTKGTWQEKVRYEHGGFQRWVDHHTLLRASRATVMKALRDLESQNLVVSLNDSNYACLSWASKEALRKESIRKDARKVLKKKKDEQTNRDWVKAKQLARFLTRKGINVERRGDQLQRPMLLIPASAFEALEEFLVRMPGIGT